MAEKQTTRNIIKITENAVKKILAGVSITQKGVLRRVNGVLRTLNIKDGNIVPDSENIRALRMFRFDLEKMVVDPAYKKRVDAFIGNFTTIKEETDDLFNGTSPNFNPNKQVYKEVLSANISLTKKSLLETGINQNVINPILSIIDNGITTGANISEMEETLRSIVVGDSQRLGGLERYVSQITRDALNQYSRNYNQSISATLGMEWYFYSGSIIEDSRSYCIKRAGDYFHKKEVEEVPSQWSGMIPGTNSANIFTNAGGFNCRHLWMPVLIDVVPSSVVERNIDNGNYDR